jgi:intein-encoded DNA endonuclease-like protein
MPSHSLREYTEVIALREKFGWGSKRISSFLSRRGYTIKKGAIDRWLYGGALPKEHYHVLPPHSFALSSEKAYLLGVFCGDGYLSTGYRVGLEVADLDFLKEFQRCLFVVYGSQAKIYTRSPRRTNYGYAKPHYSVTLGSKEIYLDLLRYDPSSFKSKTWIVPQEIKQASLQIKSSFLKGLFDSEGTIRLKAKGSSGLQLCSGNLSSLLEIKEMLLRDFDICMKLSSHKNRVPIIYTETYKDIKSFSNLIGFTIQRKKNTLAHCLSTYKRKGLRRYSPEFKVHTLDLLRQGYSTYRIGKMLGFSYTNIHDFIKQAARNK